MHRQLRINFRVGAALGASIFLLFAARQTHAQQAPPPALSTTPSTTASPECPDPGRATKDVGVSVDRKWQMEDRDLRITVTAKDLPKDFSKDLRPVICFRWKLKNSLGNPTPVDAGKISITSPNQQDTTRSVPSFTLTFPVPVIDVPKREDGTYTSDNAAPFAHVQIIMVDDQNKPVVETATSVAVVKADKYCDVPKLGTLTDSGTVSLNKLKKWQPTGGEIELAAKSAKSIQTGAQAVTCFRWRLKRPHEDDPLGNNVGFTPSDSIRILKTEPMSVQLATSVPKPGDWPARWGSGAGDYAILLVPQADVRVLLFDDKLNVVLDAATTIGITSLAQAFVITAITLVGAFMIFWLVSRSRHRMQGNSPILCLITSRHGYASLSQFQIMLWTFVVIASAAYVIALSGDLIPITGGTLVLLGISGTATLVSKVKSENDAAAAPPPVDVATLAGETRTAELALAKAKATADSAPSEEKHDADLAVREADANYKASKARLEAAEAAVEAARTRAAAATAAPPNKELAEAAAREAEINAEKKRKDAAIADSDAQASARAIHPRWSDLVMDEVKGQELDVTRVQMLCFTLVTAVFVTLRVLTSYEIPEIPESFLILMGISNSVYIASKFAANPQARS
jgi:hypothetical protein